MTNIITIDIPDWPLLEVDIMAFDADTEISYETIVTIQNDSIAVAYPGDWLTVCGGGNDVD